MLLLHWMFSTAPLVWADCFGLSMLSDETCGVGVINSINSLGHG